MATCGCGCWRCCRRCCGCRRTAVPRVVASRRRTGAVTRRRMRWRVTTRLPSGWGIWRVGEAIGGFGSAPRGARHLRSHRGGIASGGSQRSNAERAPARGAVRAIARAFYSRGRGDGSRMEACLGARR